MQAGCMEALMVNHKGEVAECTADNIFLVRDAFCSPRRPTPAFWKGSRARR